MYEHGNGWFVILATFILYGGSNFKVLISWITKLPLINCSIRYLLCSQRALLSYWIIHKFTYHKVLKWMWNDMWRSAEPLSATRCLVAYGGGCDFISLCVLHCFLSFLLVACSRLLVAHPFILLTSEPKLLKYKKIITFLCFCFLWIVCSTKRVEGKIE